jgi:hypothetical protein
VKVRGRQAERSRIASSTARSDRVWRGAGRMGQRAPALRRSRVAGRAPRCPGAPRHSGRARLRSPPRPPDGCGGTRGRLIARPRPRRQRPPARAGPFRQGPGVTMPAPARGSVLTSAQQQSCHRRNAATRPLRRPLGRRRTQAGMGRGGGAFRDGRAVHAAGQKPNISRTIASPNRRIGRYRDDDDGIRRAARRRWRGLRWSWPRRTAGTRLRVIRHAP